MVATLRVVNTEIVNSTSISVTFTENLTTNLVADNVLITSQTDNVPNSECLLVAVSGPTLTITCQPMTPYAAYFLTFVSTTTSPFISVNGDAQIMQNGVANQVIITGPLPSDNPVMDFLQNFYANNIYNTTDPTTVISQFLQAISINFAQALYSIRQLQNENYLSFTIIDELHTRGPGPYDRLVEEGSYEVLRVGYGPTDALVPTSFIFSDFPDYPITLQRQLATEIIKPSSNNDDGTFNINTLTFNLSNNPITRVDSVVFTLLTTSPSYTYDLSTLGYQIQNSEYDQDNASSYLLLANNQVKLNEAILQDPLFSLDQIFNVIINYEYKGLGIQVDSTTVDVFTTLQSVREVLPPIINVFNLQHAPITDASNNAITIHGIIFTNPNSNTGAPHPAFVAEIPFSLSALPSAPGIYAIDYLTGTIYVYGSTSLNDGTGPSPPLATYYYRFTYTPEIDYIYDTDLLNVVALPLGNLINSAGTITFNYEQVLIPGTDYNADTHLEAINESVDNNLIALNALNTQNTPITNVFQVFNQTTGEIYLIDRWYNNTVYFKYNVPPRITQELGENATFLTITNELLGINTTSTNINSLRFFTIFLANNTIINSTQDAIGASFNTSLMFVDGNVFVNEIWYNQEFDSTNNVNRLTSVGEYMVDYINGIVYVAVSTTQQADIGTASYKMNSITPDFSNIVSVDDIYYRISVLNPKNKQFSYVSFGANDIVPANLDVSDQAFLNGSATAPYQILNGMIGAFIEATFVPGVSDAVKFVRSVFEYNDLLNNTNPLNFASVSNSSNFNITVGAITGQSFESIQFNGFNYSVMLGLNLPYISPGITYTFNVVRVSDNQVLWNGSGVIVPGNPLQLILPGIGSPQVGQLVSVSYSFTIVPLQRVIVDYNKGDFFVDYTYVADILLVSYEYGDNVIDFRQNTNLSEGDNYYVSYKAGALRDALLANFGTLVNVPDLATFDLTLNRERYREALQAALSSFVQGPTIAAIKNLVQIITHAEPQVIESAFQAWSLGSNLLTPVGVQTTGSFQLLPAHFGNGVLINQPGQTITMPINNNLRLEEGTFETWILPQWHGLDNDAMLTFTITQDGQPIEPFQVFIGGSEYHPIIVNNSFSLTKLSNVSGLPNTNKDGIFIYYANDPSGTFQRWYLEVVDGYVALDNHTYQFQIASSGKFYDVKPLGGMQPDNMTTFTGTDKINMTITPIFDGYGIDGYGIDEGLTFISDLEHYLLDFGQSKDTSRLSIFKDQAGYMNFRVYDLNHAMYQVSANVASWQPNTAHMVSASWKLNTRNNRDEMHLFIDGLEVPNIIKYGQALLPYPGESFRTIDPEEIVGLSTRDIIGSDDLTTTINTNIVSSSINFSQYHIEIGDPIFINEPGFSPTGYLIEAINGQTLVLNTNLPATLTNGSFSINQTSYVITSEINVVPNIAISTIAVFATQNDLITIDNSPTVSSVITNFQALGVLPGFLLRIDNSNFALTYTITAISNNTLTLIEPMPISLSGLTFQVYSTNETELPGLRALDPNYSISQDANFNNILTIYNGVYQNELVLVRLLGLNFRDIKKRYYVWSDGYENVLMTQMSPPISLDQANITKILIPIVAIGPANATIIGGEFVSNLLPSTQPTNTITGRTIQATISGTNVNFTAPAQVFISGTTGITPISETLSFTNYGTLNFVNSYTAINDIQITATPINPAKNVLAVEIAETYPITYQEFDGYYPVIRYSYPIDLGYTLYADGFDNMVSDGYNLFSYLDIGNYMLIQSPTQVAGYYIITSISEDRHSAFLQSTSGFPSVPLPAFTNGIYQVLNTTAYRSGLQNGFFTLELFNQPRTPWLLNHGTYQVEYATYLGIKFAPVNGLMYFGTDLYGHSSANAILNQLTLSSIMLTDTRIGEIVANNSSSITKDFNSIKAPPANANTLASVDFDSFPFSNDAGYYASTNNDHIHFQSEWAVNDNFAQSVVILDQPIIIPNTGILDSRKQGTIEFWMSPLYDTANDPNCRYYFDAYSAVIEETTSVSNVSVKLSSPASRILKVVLTAGDPSIDYFVGGKLEIDTQNAIQETATSIGTGYVVVSQFILQVITVKIVGDLTGKDYFAGGVIGADDKTIYLGIPLPLPNLPLIITYQNTSNDNTHINTQVIRLNKRLPAQNSQVSVSYIPAGLQGDRISLYKDKSGYINWEILASGTTFVVRAPTRWARNTWHRVKASYQFNGGTGQDSMALYLDGYLFNSVLFGDGPTNLIFGSFPGVYGSVRIGQDGYGSDGYASLVSSITFSDPINTLYIGSDYQQSNPIYTLLDNFRISNIFRPSYAPMGEPIDPNWSSNLATVFPVTSDLYTTWLQDFNTMNALTTNFTTLVDRDNGSFDFTINIFDPEEIVTSSLLVKQILENLISILKPANTTSIIKYIPQ